MKTFESALKRLEQIDTELGRIDRTLFGELGEGGEVALIKAQIKSLYAEIGNIQLQLKRFRDALK